MTKQIFEVEVPYKFTMPIEKAETRSDGIFLVGLASGPEIDSQNERVHPSLIAKWAQQINDGAITVNYRDWHQRDSSLEDLGVVTKAWITDDNHLGVEVKLDEDHPTAVYIHKKAASGKKFGMSVFGNVISYADEFVQEVGRTVRTFYDATLDEISNTTRPVWTPSLGTVFSKAVTEAANGDTRLSEAEKTSTETKVTEVETTETTDSGADEAAETAEVTEASVTPEVIATPAVEKAITTTTKRDDKALADIVKTYNALGQKLQQAGLLDEAVESVDATTVTETPVTKSETSETTVAATSAPDVAALQKSFTELAGIVTALADRIPDGSAPGVLTKAEAVDPLAELKSVEDPMERLRLGLAAQHGSNPALR